MDKGLTLIVNPGHTPRYALYEGGFRREFNALEDVHAASVIGIKVTAPGGYFLYDRVADDEMNAKLKAVKHKAVFGIGDLLQEIKALRTRFPYSQIIGLSDSAFHISKPDYAWNYGINILDADKLDVKRFGFHGLALASVVRQLAAAEKLPHKLVVCHIGQSEVSATAIYQGRSVDTTTGFSPTEGLIMSNSAGAIDATAQYSLQHTLSLDAANMQLYLEEKSGLFGMSGRSGDLSELLGYESEGDHYAHLALQTFTHATHKGIGQMTAALGGIDALVFSGASAAALPDLRDRIAHKLHYLDFVLDEDANAACITPQEVTCISKLAHSRPVFVTTSDEIDEMFQRLHAIKL